MKKGEHRTFDIYRDEKGKYSLKVFKDLDKAKSGMGMRTGYTKNDNIAQGYFHGVEDVLYFVVTYLMDAFREC